MQQDIKAVYQIDSKSVYDIRTLSILKIKQFSIIEILKSFKQKGIDKSDEKIKKLAFILIFRGRKDIIDIIKDIYLNVSDPIKSLQRFQEFHRVLQLQADEDVNDALKTINQEQIEQLLKAYIEGNEITKKYNAEILVQGIEKYFAQNKAQRIVKPEEIRELLDHAFQVYENRITDQQNQQKEWDQVRKKYTESQKQQQSNQPNHSEQLSLRLNNEINQEQISGDQNGQQMQQEQVIDFTLGQTSDFDNREMDLEIIQIESNKDPSIKVPQKNEIPKPNSANQKSFFEIIQTANNKKNPAQQQQSTLSKQFPQKKKHPTKLASNDDNVYKQIQAQFIQLKGAVKTQKEQIIDEDKQHLISIMGDEIQLWENIQEFIKGESWYEDIYQQVESEQNSFIPILKRIAPITVAKWEKQQQIEIVNRKIQRELEQSQKQQLEKQHQIEQEQKQDKMIIEPVPQIEFNPIREEHSLFQSRLDYHRQQFKQKEVLDNKKQCDIIAIESSDEESKRKSQKQIIIDEEPQKMKEKAQDKIAERKSEKQSVAAQIVIEKLSDNIPNQFRRHETTNKYRAEDIIYTPQQEEVQIENIGQRVEDVTNAPEQEIQIEKERVNQQVELPHQISQDFIFEESIDSLEIPNLENDALDLSQDVEILEDYTKKNNLQNQINFYNSNGLQENKIFHIKPELKPLDNDQKASTLLSLLKLAKFDVTIRQVQQEKTQLLRDKIFHSFIRVIYNIVTNYLQERINIQIKQIVHNASRFFGQITIQLPKGRIDQHQYEAENQFVVHTYLRLFGLDFIIKNVFGNKDEMTFLGIIKYFASKISYRTYNEYKEMTKVLAQQDTKPRNQERIFYEEGKDNEFIEKVQQRIQPRKYSPQVPKDQQALKALQQQEYYKQTQQIQEQQNNMSKKNQKDSKQKQTSQKKQQKQDKNSAKMNQKKNKEIQLSEEEGEVKPDILQQVKQQQEAFEKNLMSQILQGIQTGIQAGIQQVQKNVDQRLQQIEDKQQIQWRQSENQQDQHDRQVKKDKKEKRAKHNKHDNQDKQDREDEQQISRKNEQNNQQFQSQNKSQNHQHQKSMNIPQNLMNNQDYSRSYQKNSNQKQIIKQAQQNKFDKQQFQGQGELAQEDFQFGQDNLNYQIPYNQQFEQRQQEQRPQPQYATFQQNLQLQGIQLEEDHEDQEQYEQQMDYQRFVQKKKKNKLNDGQGYPQFSQIIPVKNYNPTKWLLHLHLRMVYIILFNIILNIKHLFNPLSLHRIHIPITNNHSKIDIILQIINSQPLKSLEITQQQKLEMIIFKKHAHQIKNLCYNYEVQQKKAYLKYINLKI